MTDDPHRKRNQRVMKLQVCECAQLHLTYGSLTLHFDQENFLRFATTVPAWAAQLPMGQTSPGVDLIPLWKGVVNPPQG